MTSARVPVAAAILLLGLTACTPPGETDEGDPESPTGGVLGTSTVECLTATTWVLDLPQSAEALGAFLASQGNTVVSSTGSGRETLEFSAAGEFTNSVDVTYVITQLTQNGDEVTLVQTHTGTPSALWALQPDNSTILFSEWDFGGSRVQTEAIVGGSSTGVQDLTVDENPPGGMLAQCDGDSLTTQSEGSPFFKFWSAAG